MSPENKESPKKGQVEMEVEDTHYQARILAVYALNELIGASVQMKFGRRFSR